MLVPLFWHGVTSISTLGIWFFKQYNYHYRTKFSFCSEVAMFVFLHWKSINIFIWKSTEVELIMFSLLNHNEDHFWIIVHGNGIELSFLECNEKQIKTEKWEHYKHVFNENNYWNRQFYFHSEYCANWSTLLYTSV